MSGHRGTDNAKSDAELNRAQEALKAALSESRLTQKEFAKRYFDEQDGYFTDEEYELEFAKFYEKFKKDLGRRTRSSAKLNRLAGYMQFLTSMNEFKRSGLLVLPNVSLGQLSTELESGLRNIGAEIDDLLDKK